LKIFDNKQAISQDKYFGNKKTINLSMLMTLRFYDTWVQPDELKFGLTY